MKALLLGSISTVADTSELQRAAFNDAFAQHGLDWTWDRETYRDLLANAGGQDRIASYAKQTGVDVDAQAVHATKSELFQQRLGADGAEPRPGVAEVLESVRAEGGKIALVTTTSRDNVDALLDALSPKVAADHFDVIVARDDVESGKPSPDAYVHALTALGGPADEATAVEDNLDGVAAARAAGIRCFALPNENTSDHDFSSADGVLTSLSVEALA